MRRNRRKDKAGALSEFFVIASKLPWWITLIVAIFTYFVLHLLANMDVGLPKSLSVMNETVLKQVARSIASVLQYLIPSVLCIGAGVSGFRQRNRSAASTGTKHESAKFEWPEEKGPRDGAEWERRKREDALHEQMKAGRQVAKPARPFDTSRWSLELLNALEWKRFEEVCTGLFERLGFVTRSAESGADGGIDIRLYQVGSDSPAAIVQCKAWKKFVGVDVVRELRGVMASEGIPEGIFATTNSFTNDAIAFAKANHIDLMDGARILKAIETLTQDLQSSLLALATAGDYTTPTCASCGIKLVWRTPKSGAKSFWGCSNYPRCKTTMYTANSA